MTSSPALRPRCRPDGHQVFPTVVGAATLASLVLTSLVLSPPAEAGGPAVGGSSQDAVPVHEVTGR